MKNRSRAFATRIRRLAECSNKGSIPNAELYNYIQLSFLLHDFLNLSKSIS